MGLRLATSVPMQCKSASLRLGVLGLGRDGDSKVAGVEEFGLRAE